MEPRAPTHDEIKRIGVRPRFLLHPTLYVFCKLEVETLSKAARDRVLCVRQTGEIAVEALRPEVSASCGVNELDVHPHLVVGTPYAALEDVVDAELATDFLYVGRFALVCECGVARDHETS